MGNVSREMETLRTDHKEMLEIKNTAIEMKFFISLMSSSVDWTQLRKESVR